MGKEEDYGPWTEYVDATARECMRAIRVLAGNIAGDLDGDPLGSKCNGYEKLISALTETVVKLSDSRASEIVLKLRQEGAAGEVD